MSEFISFSENYLAGERVQGRVGNFLNSQTDGEDLEQRLTERPLIAGGLETAVFSTELAGDVNDIVGRVTYKGTKHKTK